MYRKVLALMLVAAPMMAQTPAAPAPAPLPPATPAPATAPSPAGAPIASPMYPDDYDRAAAKAARADMQDARTEAQKARAAARAADADARAVEMATERASERAYAQEARAAALPALAAAKSMNFNFDMKPVIAPMALNFGQGFGEGFGVSYGPAVAGGYSPRAPQGWAPQDPADSAWRQAQQAMNRGDYRRAAGLFKDIPAKQPNSVYASDALYWEAFSLYRVGGTTELQEALSVLDQRKTKYPAGRTRGDADPGLATRIAGVLS